MSVTATSIKVLNHLLADYTIVAQNARFCHWNVTGPVFEDNHEIFGEIYDYFADEIDEVAERVRALREYPVSQLAEYLKMTDIAEMSGEMAASEMIAELLSNLEKISEHMETFIREVDEDHATQDMIIGQKAEVEKKAWMLRAMLGKK